MKNIKILKLFTAFGLIFSATALINAKLDKTSKKALADSCHESWTAWTDGTFLPTTSGNYYLDTDVTYSSQSWNPSGTSGSPLNIKICLNGHLIRKTGGNAITINNYTTLEFYDCSSTEHKFSESSGVWVLDEEEGTNVITGGCLISTNPIPAHTDGIAIFINKGGTFKLHGGNIVATYAANTGGAISNNGEMYMSGGGLYGNKAKNGGAIYVNDNAYFEMTGGEIAYNTATEKGAAVYLNSGTFKMTAGTIDHNKASSAAGVYVGDTFIAGGNAKISGNKDTNDKASNLYLNNTTFALGTGSDAPTNEMNIGVSVSASQINNGNAKITTNGTSSNASNFTSDDSAYLVKCNKNGTESIDDDFLELKTPYSITNATPITASTTNNGSISVAETATYGDEVSVTVTPNSGYRLSSLVYNDGEDDVTIPENSGSYKFTMPNCAITVKATFELDQTTITLDAGEGVGGSTSVVASYGADMPSITLPTREYYDFDGYFDAETDGNQYYSSTGESLKTWDLHTSTATLYAHWTYNHVHSVETAHDQLESNCITNGHKGYYECECGKYFEDESCTIEIGDSVALDAWLDGAGKLPLAEHTYGDTLATWNNDEVTLTRTCTFTGCGHQETTSEIGSYTKVSDASCTQKETGKYVVTLNSGLFTGTYESEIFEKGDLISHDYNTPTYVWSGQECTATRTCKNCIKYETETVNAEYVKDSDATCLENEKGHYLATFANTAFDPQTTLNNSNEKPNTRLGHNMTLINGVNHSCNNDGFRNAYKCSVCNQFFEDLGGQHLIGDETTYNEWKLNAGKIEKGHNYVYVDGLAPTEDADGYRTALKCSVCGEYHDNNFENTLIGDETAYQAWKLNQGKLDKLPKEGCWFLVNIWIIIACVCDFLFILFCFYLLWKKKDFAIPVLSFVFVPLFRCINKLFYKTKLNDVELEKEEKKE